MRIERKIGFALMAALLGAFQAVAQTHHDIDWAQQEAQQAQVALAKTWTPVLGASFAPPRIVGYVKPMKTGCGMTVLENAEFCHPDNTIYVDLAFMDLLADKAAAQLKTLGDNSVFTVLAHEYGHAVWDQTNYAVMPSSEGGADCFAGVANRRAKTNGQLTESGLAEALFTMEFVSDDKRIGFDPNNTFSSMLAFALYHPDHGIVSQRQGAFMRGYYGGPTFCGGVWKNPPSPSPAGRIIASLPLGPSANISPGNALGCSLSPGPAGLTVRNSSSKGACIVNLLPSSMLLPDHFRIELTVTQLPNRATGRPNDAGIYYGDGRSTAKRTRFSFGPNSHGMISVKNIDGAPPVEEPILENPEFVGLHPSEKPGEQKLTLDVHHEGKDVYFLEYVNGVAVDTNGLFHGQQYRRLAISGFQYDSDQAGLWILDSGAEATVKDFRLLALSE